MDFWNLMTIKDDYICSFVNLLMKIRHLLSFKEQRLLHKVRKQYQFGTDDLFIILNGPSISNQDFSLLKHKQTMFVNRGFKHPKYKELRPRFHMFVDKKMLTGEWPTSWLDEIVKDNPDVIFIMPVQWAFKEKFKSYIKKGYHFYWIPFNTPASCLGVLILPYTIILEKFILQVLTQQDLQMKSCIRQVIFMEKMKKMTKKRPQIIKEISICFHVICRT